MKGGREGGGQRCDGRIDLHDKIFLRELSASVFFFLFFF